MIRFQARPVTITKAKRRAPWKRTRSYKRMTALADTMASSVRIDWVRGVRKFKTRIDNEAVYESWLSGDWSKIYETLPWSDLPGDMAPLDDSIGQTLSRTQSISTSALAEPVNAGLRFDTRNPRIRNYIATRTGNLVVGIEQDTKDFIRTAITRSFDEALTPRRVAALIKPSIGLYPQQTRALANFKLALEKEGLPLSQIDQKVEGYHDRLLDQRAIMIGRTETRFATNAGQLNVWQTAADQGLIDRHTVKKRWIVDGAPCEICEPMEGIEVGLEDLWTITYPDGSTADVDIPTESHPNCMCGMELSYGESEHLTEENEPEDT